jgi:signal transduction histidine kinase
MSFGPEALAWKAPLVALVPATLWAVVAALLWSAVRRWRPTEDYLRLLPLIPTMAALQISLEMVSEVIRADLAGGATFRAIVAPTFATEVVLACLLRHVVLARSAAGRRRERPGRPSIVATYCAGGLLAGGLALGVATGAMEESAARTCTGLFSWTLVLFTAWEIRREIRGGRLALPSLSRDIHRADIALVGFALACYLASESFGGGARASALGLEAAGDTLLAVPFALRASLASVLPRLAGVAVAAAVAGASVAAAQALAASDVRLVEHRALTLVIVLGLALVILGGRRLADRLVFPPAHPDDADQGFFRKLSPELGRVECCRRALAHVATRPAVRGAAIILADGTALQHGDLDLAPVRSVWPSGAAADSLPTHHFGIVFSRDAHLRDALVQANVASVVPLVSPRRRCGDLFLAVGLAGMRVEDADATEVFCDQLALVLEAAELLERTVAVERSLAHAEKLAAIGETAARIAHEIRNPITAARSLAQQLAREPGAPFVAEHEVILGELERVERQVASLLRFARRDELRLEPVDLSALARTTADRLRSRLDTEGIRLTVEAPERVVAIGDREKLGQVLVNLVENAADALSETPPPGRWIAVSVDETEERATVRVVDGGPGAPAETLARLFEPFFTTKSHGTGLGLAIVKRTIEAHGGRIDAERVPQAGLGFRIELPLATPV